MALRIQRVGEVEETEDDGPAPGWKTSEFWIAAATSVVSILVAVGVLTLGDASNVNEAVKQIVVSVFLIIKASLSIYAYVRSRVEVKSAANEFKTAVLNHSTAAIQLQTATQATEQRRPPDDRLPV